MVSEGLFRNRHRPLNTCHGEDMTNLPPNFPPPQPQYGPQPGGPLYGQHLLPGWENRTRQEDGPVATAFDFSFSKYATPGLIKILYILFVVFLALSYSVEVILWFLMSPILGLLVLIFGLIPALFVILVVRMGLEVSMATVRTAIDVRALRDRYVGAA